jgi:hypothetical protein
VVTTGVAGKNVVGLVGIWVDVCIEVVVWVVLSVLAVVEVVVEQPAIINRTATNRSEIIARTDFFIIFPLIFLLKLFQTFALV